MDSLSLRFFEPDNKMIEWLRNYIGDRIPIDVGCGDGDLLIELNKGGMGIDPFFDGDRFEILMEKRIHIFPMEVQSCASIIEGMGSKAIMIFARPCHSDFVEAGISLAPKGMEILYITKPSNVKDYRDLGRYHNIKKLVKHDGCGKENEVVYSIKK